MRLNIGCPCLQIEAEQQTIQHQMVNDKESQSLFNRPTPMRPVCMGENIHQPSRWERVPEQPERIDHQMYERKTKQINQFPYTFIDVAEKII